MSESKGRILVVDDDPVLLGLLVDTLTSIGYESVPATDGIQAVDILQKQEHRPFDLMITDVKMPKMDGVGLLRRVRRFYPDMPVLFITGVAGPEIIAEASPDGYLSKPFRIGHLEELIKRTLSRKAGPEVDLPHPRRVLINVPEAQIRESLTDALSATNYLAFAVETSDQALQELEHGSFDIMITDVELSAPAKTSEFKSIRRRHPKLKLVGFSETLTKSERSGSPDSPRGTQAVDAWLSPPFSSTDLVQLLDQTVGSNDTLG